MARVGMCYLLYATATGEGSSAADSEGIWASGVWRSSPVSRLCTPQHLGTPGGCGRGSTLRYAVAKQGLIGSITYSY